MKKLHPVYVMVVLLIVLFVGCDTLANSQVPPTSMLPAPVTNVLPTRPEILSTPTSAATRSPATKAVETKTAVSVSPTDTLAMGTPLPPPFQGPLALAQRENFQLACEYNAPFEYASSGFEALSFVPTGDCQNGEIGLFESEGKTYVAQSGLFHTAFTLTEVTDPAAPQVIGVWEFEPQAGVLDLKPFRQGDKQYLALGLQGNRQEPGHPCGAQIIDVTNVRQPKLGALLNGRTVGAPHDWCSVHTLEVDTDAQGNATFLIVSDVDTFSARAIDIRDLDNPRETNFYHLHAHPHVTSGQPVLNYVHDTYVGKDKIYLANWLAGVVILDKAKFEAGVPQQELVIKPDDGDPVPGGFRVHYIVPIANGDFLFIQDELNANNGIRLLDIRNPGQPKTVWVETNPQGLNAPHNFVVKDDLLFVGWYNDGVKVYRFDIGDPDNPMVKPVAFQNVRPANIKVSRDRYFDGVWGVRVNDCTLKNIERICVYVTDMSGGLSILALKE